MPKEDGLFGVLVMLPLVLILVSLVVLWACQNRIRTIRGLDSSRVRFIRPAPFLLFC
jgi:hypothetical protein